MRRWTASPHGTCTPGPARRARATAFCRLLVISAASQACGVPGRDQGGGGGGFSAAARLARLRCSRRRSRAEPLVACISTASTPAARPHGGRIYGMFRIVSRSRRGATGVGYGWLLVIAGTLASIGGNVAHAKDDLVARAIAAAIPLAVLAMLEGLKGDAGEVTRLTTQAPAGDGPAELLQADQRPHAANRRNGRTATPDPDSRAVGAQRTLPAGPRTADTTTVGTRLQAAYAQPRPDGQA